MAILTFDIGGSSVKHGIWSENHLIEKNKFKTPSTWKEMKEKLLNIKIQAEKNFTLEGVAFSAPGAVDQTKRQIEGITAIDYITSFPIYDELEECFNLPVTFENDANSAALAEVWKGSAKDNDNVLFVVIGTGIGGSVIFNKQVHHGKHLYGGEFGYAFLTEDKTFSDIGTPVAMSKRYAKRKGLSPDEIDGEQVFKLAKEGDNLAKEEVDTFFHYLTIGLYNLAYSFDPEKIILGGGVSNMDGLVERIEEEFDDLFNRLQSKDKTFTPYIELCTFRNDANLIGAVYNFIQKQP